MTRRRLSWRGRSARPPVSPASNFRTSSSPASILTSVFWRNNRPENEISRRHFAFYGDGAGDSRQQPGQVQTVVVRNGAPPPGNDAASKVTLDPEVEKKLQEILDQVKVRKGDIWTLQMKRKIDSIANVTGLKDDGEQALNAASKQAVTASLSAWTPKFPDAMLRQFSTIPKDQSLAMLSQAQGQIASVAQSNILGDNVEPEDQDVWTKALHQTLTPRAIRHVDTVPAKVKNDADKEIADVLKSGAERTRTQETNEVMAECRNIEATLKMSADRAAKLEDLGKTAVGQSVDLWRKREEKVLLSMQDNQRRMIISRGGFYMGMMPNESPMGISAWTDGLNHLLTADELAQLQAVKDTRKVKRQHVMAQVMVMLLDEKIAFTEAQRQKLQPITDRLVKDIPELYPQANPGNYSSTTPGLFYSATTRVTDAELKPILESQLKRWQSLAKDPSLTNMNPRFNQPIPATDTEPEDVERAVSSFFYEKTENERKRSLEANTLKAEDVARVAGLNADATERLQAAAQRRDRAISRHLEMVHRAADSLAVAGRHAAERQAAPRWHAGFFLPAQLRHVHPGKHLGQDRGQRVDPATADAWKKETDAREDYRANTIAALAPRGI